MSAVTSKSIIPTGTWAVDQVHSTIGFQVTDTSDMFSTIVGRFTDYDGGIEGGDEPMFLTAQGPVLLRDPVAPKTETRARTAGE